MDIWDEFGLKQNPFEVKPVELKGLIPVSTFVGREADRSKLKDIIRTRNRSLSLIVAERGMGKTSLSNVVRADLFEDYFVPLFEMDCQGGWTSEDFLLQLLGHLYALNFEVKRYESLPKKYISVCDSVHKMLSNVFGEVSTEIGGSVGRELFGLGFGVSLGRSTGSGRTTFSILKAKFKDVVDAILNGGYRGALFQFNNLDNMELEPRELAKIFANLRDFLLIDNCHFTFLGNKQMEAGFKYNPKVNEIISGEIQLGPLSYQAVQTVIKRRYDVFKMPGRVLQVPVTDDSIRLIWELHGGNIRQIFFSLDQSVVNMGKILGATQVLNASLMRRVLFNVALEKIKDSVENRAFCVLDYILRKKRDVTNTEIATALKLKPQNISKYLKQLRDSNLVIVTERVGRKVLYKPVHEAVWLRLLPDKYTQKVIPMFK